MNLEEIKNSYFIKLQRFIYNKLSTNFYLKKQLKIHRKIPKDSKYPFMCLGKMLVFDKSLKDILRVHFLHEIRVYSREDSIEEILLWGEIIKKELSGRNISWSGIHITEINFLQMELDVMSDGITNKMVMKFKFNIEDTNVSSERIINAA